jgi:hypothetical protein
MLLGFPSAYVMCMKILEGGIVMKKSLIVIIILLAGLLMACESSGGATSGGGGGGAATVKIELAAKDAICVGQAKYETGADRENIGYWMSTDATITWNFDVKEAGEYNVAVAIGCDDSHVGAMVNVTVGDKVLPFKVVSSGDWGQWKTLKIGKTNLKAGANTVVVQATSMTGSYVANLNSVVLSK